MRDYQGKRGEYDRPQGRRESVRAIRPPAQICPAGLPRAATRAHTRPSSPTSTHAAPMRTFFFGGPFFSASESL